MWYARLCQIYTDYLVCLQGQFHDILLNFGVHIRDRKNINLCTPFSDIQLIKFRKSMKPPQSCLNQMESFHDFSWYFMTYHDKWHGFVTKNHHNYVMKCHERSDLLWVLPSRCHEDVFQFNMVACIWWHVMTCHDVVNLIQRGYCLTILMPLTAQAALTPY